MPRSIRQAISSVGSSTFTTWNRRARAASFSKYFLYSAQVVAAMVRSSPRASAGLSILAASPCPAWPPAPISVCASSIKRMIGVGDFFTSSITPLSRFSNSPFTPAPACNRLRSSVRSETFFSGSGTSPSAIRWANPSTTAVLPTPASPVRIGLFCRRRVRISMICRTSASRPSTGSILPAFARPVRSIVYWSRFGVLVGPRGLPSAPVAASPADALPEAAPPGMKSDSVDRGNTRDASRRSTSGEIRRNSSEAARSRWESDSSESNATSSQAPRTFSSPKSTLAISQACLIKSQTSGESSGGRALPVLRRSIAFVRSVSTLPWSMSKCLRSRQMSLPGCSRSFVSQCSTSTL